MHARERLMAVAVTVLWGGNFIAIDFALRHFPPLFFAALRFAVIAVPTLLFVPWPRVEWKWLVGYGLGFGTMQFAFLFTAFEAGMPAGLASLVLQASAPFTVILGALLLRERVTPIQVFGIVIAILGMVVIGWHRAQQAALLPVLLTLCGAFGWALGNLCSRKANPPNPVHMTLWMSVVPPLPLLVLSALSEGPWSGWQAVGTAFGSTSGLLAFAALAYIVLLATVVGSGIWTTLMRRHPASVVAPFSLLVPIVGVTSAWIVLGQRPALVELAAGVLVVGGVLLGSMRLGRDRPAAEASVGVPLEQQGSPTLTRRESRSDRAHARRPGAAGCSR